MSRIVGEAVRTAWQSLIDQSCPEVMLTGCSWNDCSWESAGGGQIVDVPLLFEGGLHRFAAKRVTVACSPEVQLQRLMARDQSTKKDAAARIASQMPLEDKIARSEVCSRPRTSLVPVTPYCSRLSGRRLCQPATLPQSPFKSDSARGFPPAWDVCSLRSSTETRDSTLGCHSECHSSVKSF